MLSYRFVDVLGRAVETAGQAVADAADVTSDHQGGLIPDQPGVEERVGGELLRQMARETDGRELERATFAARSVRVDGSKHSPSIPGVDIGLVVSIDLPTYRATSVALGTVLHTASLPEDVSGTNGTPVRDRVQSLVERTPASFLLLVTETGTRAIPGRSLLAMADPATVETLETHLYGRALGRFVQDLAEGFVGVSRLDGDTRPLAVALQDGTGLREWAKSHQLDGVYSLTVGTTQDRTESSLSAFLD
ncbi:MAG: hypothetical protein U5K70_07675 [Halodesulfurarchaeum sp.]|nr:hypothetical protein [Halodesulfurarchaeum sp.]